MLQQGVLVLHSLQQGVVVLQQGVAVLQEGVPLLKAWLAEAVVRMTVTRLAESVVRMMILRQRRDRSLGRLSPGLGGGFAGLRSGPTPTSWP